MQPADFNLQAAIKYAEAFTSATGIGCALLDRRGIVRYPDADEYPCRLCRAVSGSHIDLRTSSQGHWVWVEQAAVFGGRFIAMCRNSFTHWTAPIVIDGRIAGGFVAGPVLTIEEADFFDGELVPAGASAKQRENLLRLFEEVPRIAPGRVTSLATIVSGLARSVSDTSALSLDDAEAHHQRQSRMGEYVHDLKIRNQDAASDPRVPAYPVETERSLLEQIRLGNIARAQETLNELLGHVFFASGSGIEAIRARTRELVTLLSRAVMTEGADPEEVFGLNYRFVDALDQQSDVNGVAFWMARIVRRFADLVLYMPNVAHGLVLRRALSYIRSHLAETIRVADVAQHVGLSPTYFSRVFADEMRVSFVGYVNRARIDRARDLLRTTTDPVTKIASEVGINDHSYFTKLFRKETGVAPSVYRGSAG